MARKKKGRCVKKNKIIDVGENPALVNAPHSFVIHRGIPGDHIVELTKNFRKVMEPFTASSLKTRKQNSIKDFVSVAGVLHVTHMCIFTKTTVGMYLKLSRLPRGPTLTFQVLNFSLMRDVISTLKKQFVFEEAFNNPPLVVLNNFSGEGMQMKLMATMFQNMFPTINLNSVKLSHIRRCVCLNYNSTTKTVDFRHYAIKVAPVGLSRGVKKIIQAKVPNLSKCEEISEFLTKPTLSESEAEDDPDSHVTLGQKLSSRGCHQNSQSAIRLSELGPRLTLKLLKVEDGLMDGEVLYHERIIKTEEEKSLINKRREEKKRLKEKRKKLQEENISKKDSKKQEQKEKSLKGMKNKRESDVILQKLAKESQQENKVEDDDDAQYYREEVGEEPDKELFEMKNGKKRSHKFMPNYKVKKTKITKDNNHKKTESKKRR